MSVVAVGVAVVGAAASAYSTNQTNKQNRKIAGDQYALGMEELEWKKQMYADGAGERAAANARAQQMSDAQVSMMNQQMALAQEYADYNQTTFRPLEEAIVKDAKEYDTPERREAAAAAAKADVENNLAAQRGIATREMNRRGVNPTSGKALALGNEMAIRGASMQAGASNAARTQVETIGHARQMDAASLGRNLPGNQATAAGLALNASNSAANTAQIPLRNNIDAANMLSSGYGAAQTGMRNAAATYGSMTDDSQLWARLGSAAGKIDWGQIGSQIKYSGSSNDPTAANYVNSFD